METILDTAKIIGTALAEFVLMIYFCKQYIDKNSDRINIGKGVKEQSEISKEIIDTMDYYKELLHADRILLFEFHNGQHYSNYRSALKMSVSHEVYKASLSSVREKCSGLPIAVMPHFVAAITNDGQTFCRDLEDIKGKMGSSYEFKKSLGIKSFYDVAIRDAEGNTIGFVAVQWNTVMPDDIDTQNILKLAGYLESSIKKLVQSDRKNKREKVSLFK